MTQVNVLLEDDGCSGAPSLLFKHKAYWSNSADESEDLIADGMIAVPDDAQSYNYDEEKGSVYFKFWYDGDFVHNYYEYTEYGIIEFEHTGFDNINGMLEWDNSKYHSMTWGGSSDEEDHEMEMDAIANGVYD